ncbi:hypothetical protein [Paraburkholderia strydomiana]|uniref:hypothetical protein n=1 Tax=Paraburkholderia strydomiana TaxID=1245417 RepID=UPI0038BA85DA
MNDISAQNEHKQEAVQRPGRPVMKGLNIFSPGNMEQESAEGEGLQCGMRNTDHDPCILEVA